MDLKVPVKISDELEDEVIEATGMLDLASGEIREVVYAEYDPQAEGYPADRPDYDFTSGTLSNNGREVEFQIDVVRDRYSVNPTELLELKQRAAKLFAGITDEPPPAKKAARKTPGRR